MAKKTKRSNLSIAERLEHVLVSNENAPYALPGNWCWVKLSGVADFERGITFPASAKEFSSSATNIPCLRTANVQEQLELNDLLYVDRSYTKDNSNKIVRENDIIMSTANSRELVGKTSFVHSVTEEMTFGGFVMAIRSKIEPQYLFYFLRLQFLNGKFMGNSTQTTNIANINSTSLGETETPVPPLDEQKRIVDRIESLFTKLDEAKEKAQEVVDGFEDRRAAILQRAFSGELTAKWRTNRDVSDLWETKKLSDVAHLQTGLMKGKKFNGDTVFMPYLRVANVQDGYLDLNEVKTIEVSKANYERYLLRKGDVLFTEGGDYDKLGRGTVWNGEIPNCLHQNHIFVVRVDSNCLMSDFLSYQAGSQYGKKYFMSCAKQTTNLASINSTQLKNFPVMLPTLDEQQEIVRVLNIVLAKEKQAKEAAKAVLEQIDRQKKAILARAFRGELGTNDPSDESTVELLKRII